MKDKPDNVVFNKETNVYDAFLKPYATSFTAPSIKANNLVNWKQQNIQNVNAQFSTLFDEVKSTYSKLIEEYRYNELIYNSKFSFQPIVGNVYYLYKRKNGELFLSILSPKECNFNYVGSFKLNSDKIWKKQANDSI